MALLITSGYTVSAGEVWTPTKHNLSTVPNITLAQGEIMARSSAGTGNVEVLTVAQLRTLLGLGIADTPTFAGLVLSGGMNNVPIGNTTPAAGGFTTLDSSGRLQTTLAAGGQAQRWVSSNTTGLYVRIATSANDKGFIGTGDQIIAGGSVNDVGITTDTGQIIFGSTANYFGKLSSTKLDIIPSTASTSTVTGALTVAGGVGIAGAVWIGATCNANAFNTTSARRFKKNIRALHEASLLQQLRPVWYDQKAPGSGKRFIGFIAEELNKVLPSMVLKDSKGRPLAVNYGQLVALAVAGLQDQEKRLAKLERSAS